jgi:hypothetical protein
MDTVSHVNNLVGSGMHELMQEGIIVICTGYPRPRIHDGRYSAVEYFKFFPTNLVDVGQGLETWRANWA